MLHEYFAESDIQDRERQLIWQLENQHVSGEGSAFRPQRSKVNVRGIFARLAHHQGPTGRTVTG